MNRPKHRRKQKQSSRNLTPLFEANGDCIGWICIPNTAVNYPVMFTPEEPPKYLRKNFEGEYSVSGIPFLDGAFYPECDNLIVYGSNMKNGTMFFDVTQYRDKAYWEEHPYIEFETAGGIENIPSLCGGLPEENRSMVRLFLF